MLNQDWDIKPCGAACAQCGTAFADRQAIVSRLAFGTEGYTRADFCDNCRTRREDQGAAVSVWKAVFRVPPPPVEAIKKETAETLLRGLIAKNDQGRKNAIFVLTVMLERRRILVERDVQKREDGSLLRVYEHRRTGESFVIADPMLDLNQIEHVQLEITTMLAGAEAPAKPENPDAGLENSGGNAP